MSLVIETHGTRREMVQNVLSTLGQTWRVNAGESVCLVVNLIDHEAPLGSVHVDTVRVVLDWLATQEVHDVMVSAGAKRDTARTLSEFGFDVLQREFPGIIHVDLNQTCLPTASKVIFVSGCTVVANHCQQSWKQLTGDSIRHYGPEGEIWMAKASDARAPELILVDAMVVADRDAVGAPAKRVLQTIVAGFDMMEIDAYFDRVTNVKG